MQKNRAFLKWAGGKYRCLETLLSHLPPGKRLIEPFVGSGVVFLNTHYKRFQLADTNADLIYLYQSIQTHGMAFIRHCQTYFTPQYNQKESYYELRHAFNTTQDPLTRASLFLYLNRHGYNGLCRYNLKGQYNVPFGQYERPYFPEKELLHFHQKSRHAQFDCVDFRTTLTNAKQGDVIYCDPPYAPISQHTNFSAYGAIRFGEKEQIELATLAIQIAKKGIPVIISNHDTAFTRHHYQTGDIRSFSVRRSINCDVHARRSIKELLVIFS